MIYFGYRSSYGLTCDLFCNNRGCSEMHLGKCQVWTCVWADGLFFELWDVERMYMAWLLSWWCLPSTNLFWHCTFSIFLLNALFCALTYHYVVDSAKKILYKPDTVYNIINDYNNSISSEGNQQSNNLTLQWTLLLFPDNNCTTITVILKGTLRSQ